MNTYLPPGTLACQSRTYFDLLDEAQLNCIERFLDLLVRHENL